MNLVNCDYCGILTSEYIEVIAEDLQGIIICEDCSRPDDPVQDKSFEEWWKQYEEYQKLKPRGRNGFDRVVQESRVQVDANLKILK